MELQPTERGTAPSCSSFARYAQCLGSYQIAALVPEPPSSAVAELGNAVHADLAGEKVTLTDEGQMLSGLCRKALDALHVEIGVSNPQTALEKRLWWDNVYSGQADRIDVWGDNALVVDYKTGRGSVDPAERNMQLRGLAVLVKRHYPEVKTVFAAIIAPMSIGTTATMYDEGSLAVAANEILLLMEAIQTKNAPRRPSPEACKYCRAKSICPEIKQDAMTLVAADKLLAVSDEAMGEWLVRADYIEEMCTALRVEAKNRIKNGATIPGWKLGAGRKSRSIKDASAAYQLLADAMSAEEFAGCCKVSVPSLEKAFAKAKALKGKEAKEAFDGAVAPVMEFTESSGALERIKA
jgi:hypothetical protein